MTDTIKVRITHKRPTKYPDGTPTVVVAFRSADTDKTEAIDLSARCNCVPGRGYDAYEVGDVVAFPFDLGEPISRVAERAENPGTKSK